jgi:hypothetical protein
MPVFELESSWRLWIIPINALVLIECGANLPDGWQGGISAGGAHQSEESRRSRLHWVVRNT